MVLYLWKYHRWLNIPPAPSEKNIKEDGFSFDEKLWWLKIYYHNPLMTVCADKYAVRDYVKKCGLEDILVELYGKFNSIQDIDIEMIPSQQFYLKCNHLSGANRLCHKSTFVQEREKLNRVFGYYLKNNCYRYGYEWPYKNIVPCIIAESVLETDEPYGLLDYKFMCFSGEPKYLFLDIGVAKGDGTHAEEYFRNIYDMEFMPVDMKETREHYDFTLIPKPLNWDFMIDVCRRLSKPFPHCRVDLYNIHGRVYFGEMTFFHGSGMNDFKPREAGITLGNMIPLVSYGK
ncbi:MAG: ATP-grasp fold amidoligase family protein [Prevotella sp.]